MRPWYYIPMAFVAGLLLGAFLVGWWAISDTEQDLTAWVLKHRVAPMIQRTQ